jgi:hypothetical protein
VSGVTSVISFREKNLFVRGRIIFNVNSINLIESQSGYECDMVLGVNTTAQHCAAAMGVKTWCLVPTWHQWRYAQPSMPWYRHMRIIYQDNDTWKEVINKVAKQLNGTW